MFGLEGDVKRAGAKHTRQNSQLWLCRFFPSRVLQAEHYAALLAATVSIPTAITVLAAYIVYQFVENYLLVHRGLPELVTGLVDQHPARPSGG